MCVPIFIKDSQIYYLTLFYIYHKYHHNTCIFLIIIPYWRQLVIFIDTSSRHLWHKPTNDIIINRSYQASRKRLSSDYTQWPSWILSNKVTNIVVMINKDPSCHNLKWFNLEYLFTKEDKDVEYFITICDALLQSKYPYKMRNPSCLQFWTWGVGGGLSNTESCKLQPQMDQGSSLSTQ